MLVVFASPPSAIVLPRSSILSLQFHSHVLQSLLSLWMSAYVLVRPPNQMHPCMHSVRAIVDGNPKTGAPLACLR